MNALSHLHYHDTTYFSVILERIGVTEIWRKFDKQTGCVTFGTGVTTAVNHDAGTMPDWNAKQTVNNQLQ